MTANRNLKQRVRARALKTGESYSAARHQLADGRSSMTVAAAQLPLLPDPGDTSQIRASGDAVRALMQQANACGAGLVHFPEGALISPGKRVMSSTGPDNLGPADWDRADWAGLGRELDEIVRLAGRLRLWTVVGGIHRSAPGARPGNCLFVISSRGRLIGRYDERMLSKTKSTLMYTAGRDPLAFTASGVRFGCALAMETHYPGAVRRLRGTRRRLRPLLYPRQPGSPRHLRHRGGRSRRRQLPLGQLLRSGRG